MSVVLLWLSSDVAGLDVVERVARRRGAILVQSTHGAMRGIGSDGPSVAVVEDDRGATEAFAAGADEVVRRGELDELALDRAIEHATARHPSEMPEGTEGQGIRTLADWVATELVTCISAAVLEHETFDSSVRAHVAGPCDPQSGVETLEMLDTIRESLKRTRELVDALRVLASQDDGAGMRVAPLLKALVRVAENTAAAAVDVEIAADPACRVAASASALVRLLVLLVGDAFARAPRRQGTSRPKLLLRAKAEGDRVVVEVEDREGDGPRAFVGVDGAKDRRGDREMRRVRIVLDGVRAVEA